MSDLFAEFTDRTSVYERAAMSLSALAWTPFGSLGMGEQYRWNDYADTLVGLSLSYMRQAGESDGYRLCASLEEQVAYCVCLKFGNRWDRIERLAPWLHSVDHWRRWGQRDGEASPAYPFE
jgi:hypothetical protein